MCFYIIFINANLKPFLIIFFSYFPLFLVSFWVFTAPPLEGGAATPPSYVLATNDRYFVKPVFPAFSTISPKKDILAQVIEQIQ